MKNDMIYFLGKLFLAGVLTTLVGCASIVNGTKQEVTISSDPSKASLRILTAGGQEVYNGTTPASVKLQRKKEYDVFISLEGYKEEKIHISKGFNSWYLGNLICGGIIGLIIDATNGAMNKLEPGIINVSLATAYREDGTMETYAIFRALDDEGQPRTLLVPLIKS